jgi:hypothetical protein
MNAAAGVDIDGYFGPGHACHRHNCDSYSVKEIDGQGARIVNTLSSSSGWCTNDAYRSPVLNYVTQDEERVSKQVAKMVVLNAVT